MKFPPILFCHRGSVVGNVLPPTTSCMHSITTPVTNRSVCNGPERILHNNTLGHRSVYQTRPCKKIIWKIQRWYILLGANVTPIHGCLDGRVYVTSRDLQVAQIAQSIMHLAARAIFSVVCMWKGATKTRRLV